MMKRYLISTSMIGWYLFCALCGAVIVIAIQHGFLISHSQAGLNIERQSNSILSSSDVVGKVPQTANQYVDLRYAAQNTLGSVVHVKTVQMGREYVGNPFFDFWFGVKPQTRAYPQTLGSGSGVIVSSDGYIITNNHLVKGSDLFRVILYDKREFDAKVIGVDVNTDLALLKIDAKDLSPITFGDSESVDLGEWVLAVGNPYNLTSTVTAGIISAKSRDLGGEMGLESFLQTDAVVNPGSSGGALVNAKGELIGINTAIQSPTRSYIGYSFAIPVNIVKKVMQDLRKYGSVQKPVLGIKMSELTPSMAEELGIDKGYGIYIGEVIPGSPADKANLKSGDVILKMDEKVIKTFPEFQEQFIKYAPGDKITLTIYRNGRETTQDVYLHSDQRNMSVVNDDLIDNLGVRVKSLSTKMQYKYHINNGLVIDKLGLGLFKKIGLKEGDILLSINERPLSDESELKKIIQLSEGTTVNLKTMSSEGKISYYTFSVMN